MKVEITHIHQSQHKVVQQALKAKVASGEAFAVQQLDSSLGKATMYQCGELGYMIAADDGSWVSGFSPTPGVQLNFN